MDYGGSGTSISPDLQFRGPLRISEYADALDHFPRILSERVYAITPLRFSSVRLDLASAQDGVAWGAPTAFS